jgi:hypothetical protein
LERSHTVGDGGGEERRSVIGRRMMQRLGNRVAIGKLGDNSLPILVPTMVSKGMQVEHATIGNRPSGKRHDTFGTNQVFLVPPVGRTDDHVDPSSNSQRFNPPIIQDDSSSTERYPPLEDSRPSDVDHLQITPTKDTTYSPSPSTTLAPLDYMHPSGRAPSRTSAVSEIDAFEYEVHLRRSLSEKERKGRLQKQITPEKEKTGRLDEEEIEEERLVSPLARNEEILPDTDLPTKLNVGTSLPPDDRSKGYEGNTNSVPPLAISPSDSYHSPIPLGHMPPASPESSLTSNNGSSDPMARIPFMLAGSDDTRPPRLGPRLRTGREESMASFPAEVGEGDEGRSSGFGTPGRDGEIRGVMGFSRGLGTTCSLIRANPPPPSPSHRIEW